MPMASTARTAESIGPAGFLTGGLADLLAALELLEPRQGGVWTEPDRTAGHGLAGFDGPVGNAVPLRAG